MRLLHTGHYTLITEHTTQDNEITTTKHSTLIPAPTTQDNEIIAQDTFSVVFVTSPLYLPYRE